MTSPPTSASYSEPSSVLGKNLYGFRQMLANVDAIQTLFGAANATEALERIYIEALPRPASGDKYTLEELESYRPFALIAIVDGQIMRSDIETVGGQWTHGRRGAFDLLIERKHPTSGADDVNALAWIDLVDRVRGTADVDNPGLIELADNGDGYLSIRTVEVAEIWRGDENERQLAGDFQCAVLRVFWGRL